MAGYDPLQIQKNTLFSVLIFISYDPQIYHGVHESGLYQHKSTPQVKIKEDSSWTIQNNRRSISNNVGTNIIKTWHVFTFLSNSRAWRKHTQNSSNIENAHYEFNRKYDFGWEIF